MPSPPDSDPPQTDPPGPVIAPGDPETFEATTDREPGDEAAQDPQEQVRAEHAHAEEEVARSAINSQIADALALTDSAAAAGAAIVAAGGSNQVAAHCSALAMLNAVSAQQNAQVTANAAVVAAVRGITAALRGGRPQ